MTKKEYCKYSEQILILFFTYPAYPATG